MRAKLDIRVNIRYIYVPYPLFQQSFSSYSHIPIYYFFLQKKNQKADQEEISKEPLDAKEEAEGEKVTVKRPLNMEDMRQAKTQVSSSFASDGSVMNMLKEWNELYGEGRGTRKKKQLSYFL